jgi:phage antirepressor YoqD-like protein
MSTTKKIGAKELAEQLGIDPKDLRVWLRENGKGLGKRGKRYEFSPKQATDLKAKYQAGLKDDGDEG